MQYALYARKSHDDTKLTEKSLKDQIAVWRSADSRSKYDIVREYRESKSAKDPDVRPLFREMIKRIKSGEIEGILTWHINRLTRNMVEGGVLADLLMRGTLREIRTPNAVYRPKDNIIPLILEAATATQNNRDHTEAVLRGMNSRTEEGGWTHRAPIGYLNRRDPVYSKRGILVRDQERFHSIQRAWKLLAVGSYNVQQVIDIMNNDWGLRTRQTASRGGGKITNSHGYKIFSNVFYAGYVLRDGRLRKGNHDAMVTVHEFNKVQELIRQHLKPYGKRKFVFTGMIRCGACGLQVTAGHHWKAGVGCVYYRCSDSRRSCTKKGINEIELINQVTGILTRITLDPLLCEIALENIARWQEGVSREAEGAYQGLYRSLESVEGQLDNLLSLRLREVISDDTLYKEKEADLLAERNRLQLAVQEVQEEYELVRRNAANGFEYLKFVRDRFMLADIEKKREYARALGSYELKDKHVSIILDPLLAELVKFSDEIVKAIEPRLDGSQSLYRATLGSTKSFGRAKMIQFEPVASLLRELRAGCFPDLFSRRVRLDERPPR